MTLRRDFLAFTAGAVAARTVLPIGARAETPTPASHPDADLIRLAEAKIGTELKSAQDRGEISQPGGDRQTIVRSADNGRAQLPEIGIPRQRAAEYKALAAAGEDAIRDAAPAGVITVVAPSPDADLLEACAAFDALERAYIAVPGNHPPGSLAEQDANDERDRLSEAQQPFLDRICELRAITREGQAARARSYALWDAELMKDGTGDVGTFLTAAIVRDLLAHIT